MSPAWSCVLQLKAHGTPGALPYQPGLELRPGPSGPRTCAPGGDSVQQAKSEATRHAPGWPGLFTPPSGGLKGTSFPVEKDFIRPRSHLGLQSNWLGAALVPSTPC